MRKINSADYLVQNCKKSINEAILYKHEKYEEAIVQLKKALEIDPDNPETKRNLEAVEKAIK